MLIYNHRISIYLSKVHVVQMGI